MKILSSSESVLSTTSWQSFDTLLGALEQKIKKLYGETKLQGPISELVIEREKAKGLIVNTKLNLRPLKIRLFTYFFISLKFMLIKSCLT